MKVLDYTITDELGLHARPAGLLVNASTRFDCKVTIKSGTKVVDGNSILGVMTLGLKQGDVLNMTFEGPEEEGAYNAVKAFVEENL
ncbi:MAG TPA: HPr family phosphocarrier protein [Clostridiales bacterium]|nr:HPr family phosphocarrier protein [Clostridiales bacterium]